MALHNLGRQSKPTIFLPIDEPTGVEVAQGMHAGVFGLEDRFALAIFLASVYGDTCGD